jgi:hypothetical protein
VSIKLKDLLIKFNQKMLKDKNSNLKLADVITLRKILSDKIHREIQGFRTSPSEYKELDQVNPQDIKKIIKEIKMKLGN